MSRPAASDGRTGVDLTITRLGDVITIQPVRQSPRDAVAMLRQIPKPTPEEALDRTEVPDRRRAAGCATIK
jgi:virulence-associated protein VagC